MLQPLIKRPGGKYNEFDYIKGLIPPFKRYIEPFFGGGGIFFRLQPETGIINDISSDLISLYHFTKTGNVKFKKELEAYVTNREKIPKYISHFISDYILLYSNYKKDKINDMQFEDAIKILMQSKLDAFNGLFNKQFSIDNDNLLKQITKNIINKLKRTKKLEEQKGNLPKGDLEKNIETGFRSGFYMHFRDIMNFDKKYKISKEKKAANYYFIREFCYASMFRYNKDGHFNIPYGGIGYNYKDFRKKVNYLLSKKVHDSFKNIEIRNEDFEKLLDNKTIKKDDFVFLDPPYDSEFDDYHGDVFTKKDQERLAKCLYNFKGKFLLIIKKTEFIQKLYINKPGIKIDSFEKKYLVNIKGRNDQNVQHLVIYNY